MTRDPPRVMNEPQPGRWRDPWAHPYLAILLSPLLVTLVVFAIGWPLAVLKAALWLVLR